MGSYSSRDLLYAINWDWRLQFENNWAVLIWGSCPGGGLPQGFTLSKAFRLLCARWQGYRVYRIVAIIVLSPNIWPRSLNCSCGEVQLITRVVDVEWRNECLFIVFGYRSRTSLAMLDKHSGMLCHNIFLRKIYFYSRINLSNEMPFSHRFVSLEKNLSVDCVNICTICMYTIVFSNEFELSVCGVELKSSECYLRLSKLSIIMMK